MKARPVLYLSHTAELSGAELSLLALMTELDRTRFAPVALLPESGPFLDRLVDSEVPVHVLPLGPGTVRSPGGILRNMRLLRGFQRAHGIRVVHANSFHAIKQAAPGRRLDPTPLVGHIRDIIPFTRLTRAAIFSCDRVVCVSRATAGNLAGAGGPRREGRIRVIHNGVDPGAFSNLPSRQEALDALGLGRLERPLVGMAAPLVEWKGQDRFLEAAALVSREIPGATFLIAGGESFAGMGYIDRLRRMADAEGLAGRVHFLGFTHRIRELFAALDVVVCPSVEPDPLPRAVLEAMAAGRPVVATAIGGIPEAVSDGSTGILVPPGDGPALARGILSLLEDDVLRRRCGREAMKAVAERFSLQAHTGRVMDLYEELLES